MDAVFYGFTVLLFAAVILMIEGAYLWWSGTHGGGAKRIARRLRLMSGGMDANGEKVSILKQRRYCDNDWLDAFLHRRRLAQAIDRLLLQAGLRWSVAQFMGAAFGGMCVALLLLQMRPAPPVAQVVIALMFMSAPYVLARRARTARLIKIEEQLPEAADFLARAMRAGHSFTNVLQMVGSELPEPLSGEFRTAHEEINYGVPLNEALYSLADRIPLTDLRYLVIAVVIQRESGGNLAEILGNISHIIRARLKLLGKVRVLSAEGRMSAWILGLMPFCAMFFMLIANPKYVSVLWTDPTGQTMLWYGAGMILIGVLWIRRVIHIRV
ncbi:type II secretion system F family protein [Massilia sp. CF038]|uniref:type II secretion system F family protein n=1 Tax=Massilia sp. CF038 TaxID=1881045 RepID=UPI0009116FBF|nr:tight adherence protein B [Massilia sp. CF038]